MTVTLSAESSNDGLYGNKELTEINRIEIENEIGAFIATLREDELHKIGYCDDSDLTMRIRQIKANRLEGSHESK